MPGPRKTNIKGMECFKNFVHFTQENENIIEKVKDIGNGYAPKDLHPFIVVTLKDDQPDSFHAVGFEAIYRYNSFLGALNCVFAMFFVFNRPFPKDLLNVFVFIQQFLYEIYITAKDKKIRKVINFIELCDRSRLASVVAARIDSTRK